MSHNQTELLKKSLAERILILDGAMGTMIQKYKLTEADFRGERFKESAVDLRGNNDLLTLTQPLLISAIHEKYLQAGADIIETNTFSSTTIAQADYDLQSIAYELNFAGAKLARLAADKYSTPEKPRFVAGVLGPTNRTASISPDVNDPGFRNITFMELVDAYAEAIKGLIEGGADLIMIETIFDTLNAKAAIFAIAMAFFGKFNAFLASIPLPVMGGIMLLLFGTIASLGIKTLVDAKVDLMQPKNLVIVSSVLTVGVGGMAVHVGTLSFAGVGLCAILAIVLNFLLPDPKTES